MQGSNKLKTTNMKKVRKSKKFRKAIIYLKVNLIQYFNKNKKPV